MWPRMAWGNFSTFFFLLIRSPGKFHYRWHFGFQFFLLLQLAIAWSRSIWIIAVWKVSQPTGNLHVRRGHDEQEYVWIILFEDFLCRSLCCITHLGCVKCFSFFVADWRPVIVHCKLPDGEVNLIRPKSCMRSPHFPFMPRPILMEGNAGKRCNWISYFGTLFALPSFRNSIELQ